MKTANDKEKSWSAIVLAAGKGTRMASPLPKVLHPAAGRPMLERILFAMHKAKFKEIRVVLGHRADLVKNLSEPLGCRSFLQHEQKGTGDAVLCAEPDSIVGPVLIMAGDHPLINADDLLFLQQAIGDNDLLVATCKLKKPKGFGRIVRQKGAICAIVEEKDASFETKKINEVNTGIYLLRAGLVAELMRDIKPSPVTGEYYLTEIVALALERGLRVGTVPVTPRVAFGVNSQAELARATGYLYQKKARDLMAAGVLILDPKTTYIEDLVEVAAGSVIYPNVFIRGKTKIGTLCAIEPNCFIKDSIIGDSVEIHAQSHLERVQVHNQASIGPFARLRPETVIGEGAHVGNFVEMKKTVFGKKSKAGHLTYLGDAIVGEGVNIGCGTITCNYAVDRKKYVTEIGDNAFVGSDTQFVAPVKVGAGAVVASGSTITKDVPDQALAFARARQVNKENYVKKEK